MIRNIIILFLLAVCGYLTYLQTGWHTLPKLVPADMVLPDGAQYFGDLKNNVMHGQGELVWTNHNRFVGEFKDGLRDGPGELWEVDGHHYKGQFKQGLFDGKGVESWKNGNLYDGDFVAGVAEGQGTFQYSNGDVYKGQFQQGQFNGEGTFTTNGNSYTGEFADDEISSGVYLSASGERYEGGFKDWMFEGEGELITEESDIYRGTFAEGVLVGKGTHTTRNGVEYTGEFEGFSYHGEGRLRQENGDVYEGQFAYGSYEGEGTLTLAEEKNGFKTLTGQWSYGYLDNDPREKQYDYQQLEKALYLQPQLLETAATGIPEGVPGKSELYFMGVASYARQDVFLKEINTLTELFRTPEFAGNRFATLVNNYETIEQRPLATATSVETMLNAFEQKMNLDEDILFLYFTSHGSKDHKLSIQLNGMRLNDLSAEHLSKLIEQSKIKWKVIMISACYSGGFIEGLMHENTLVMTAARSDRTSFGCGDDSDMTYFARAYFEEALPKSQGFIDAFYTADKLVKEWEKRDLPKADHSLPQISIGSEIAKKLEHWNPAKKESAPASPASDNNLAVSEVQQGK